MKKSGLLGAGCAFIIPMLSTAVNAALVTEIIGLDINGTSYDVTFHESPATFRNLWDVDGDWMFNDSDGSVFNTAPTFWGDQTGALAAAEAIMAKLGTGDTTVADEVTDSFLIPYDRLLQDVKVRYDGDFDPGTDLTIGNSNVGNNDVFLRFPYASFVKSAVVPVPATAWLFGSGLLGLIGVARRKVLV